MYLWRRTAAKARRIESESKISVPATCGYSCRDFGQTAEIHSVGVDVLLICREDLDEETVYRTLNTFFYGIQELAQKQTVFRSVNLRQAQCEAMPEKQFCSKVHLLEKGPML